MQPFNALQYEPEVEVNRDGDEFMSLDRAGERKDIEGKAIARLKTHGERFEIIVDMPHDVGLPTPNMIELHYE